MVVEADPAAHLRRVRRDHVVVLRKLLRVVVDRLGRLAGLAAPARGPAASGREVAAAGADDQVVAVAEVELARPLEHVRIVLPLLRVETVGVAPDVRAARLDARVREHLAELLRVEAVVAGELDAPEADRREVLKRPLEADARNDHLAVLVLLAGDVGADRVELERDLGVDALARSALRPAAARQRERGRAEPESREKFPSGDVHSFSFRLGLKSTVCHYTTKNDG